MLLFILRIVSESSCLHFNYLPQAVVFNNRTLSTCSMGITIYKAIKSISQGSFSSNTYTRAIILKDYIHFILSNFKLTQNFQFEVSELTLQMNSYYLISIIVNPATDYLSVKNLRFSS